MTKPETPMTPMQFAIGIAATVRDFGNSNTKRIPLELSSETEEVERKYGGFETRNKWGYKDLNLLECIEAETKRLIEQHTSQQLAEATAWRPIDTVPKDGTAILLRTDTGVIEARFDKGSFDRDGVYEGDMWVCFDGSEQIEDEFISGCHWQPLPAPPSQTEDA